MKLLISDWFKPEHDESARFLLRGLTGLETLELLAEMNSRASGGAVAALAAGKVPLSPSMVKTTLSGLVGWEGVIDRDGRPIDFSVQARDALDLQTVNVLVAEIIDRTFLTEAAEKN